MVYQSEKTLGEVGDKIPTDEKAKVQSGIAKLKEVLKGDDTDAIKAATEELTQMFYQMSEKLYQQTGAQAGGPDMGGQQPGGSNGGSTNSIEIVVRAALKPTPSISREQMTYNEATGRVAPLEIRGRHDVCVALRGAVVVEAARDRSVALVLNGSQVQAGDAVYITPAN